MSEAVRAKTDSFEPFKVTHEFDYKLTNHSFYPHASSFALRLLNESEARVILTRYCAKKDIFLKLFIAIPDEIHSCSKGLPEHRYKLANVKCVLQFIREPREILRKIDLLSDLVSDSSAGTALNPASERKERSYVCDSIPCSGSPKPTLIVFQLHFEYNAVKLFQKELENVLESGDGSDMKFKFNDGKEIAAHRFVLAMHSDVFVAMFAYGMQESNSGEVQIDDFTEPEFRRFLRYVYTCQLPATATVTDYLVLIRAGHKYQVPGLVECIAPILPLLITVENVLEILIFADMFDMECVADKCIELMPKHPKGSFRKRLATTLHRPALANRLFQTLFDQLK